MRKYVRPSFIVYALLIAFAIYTTLSTLHFYFVTILLGSVTGSRYYWTLRRRNLLHWLLPVGLMVGAALGTLNYLADLLLFPHTQGMASRLFESGMVGLLPPVTGIAFGQVSKSLPGDTPIEGR